VIFVSHDRYFIDRLATRVFEVEGGHVHVYPGNYEDYLWRKQGGTAGATPVVAAISSLNPSATITTPAAGEKDKDKIRRVNPIRLRQMQERLAFVEEEVPRIEASIGDLEQSLGIFVSAEETERLSQQLQALREQQSMLTLEWEELMLQLEEQQVGS
jgi:ATP-binding cassette subfamily F protein 3